MIDRTDVSALEVAIQLIKLYVPTCKPAFLKLIAPLRLKGDYLSSIDVTKVKDLVEKLEQSNEENQKLMFLQLMKAVA